MEMRYFSKIMKCRHILSPRTFCASSSFRTSIAEKTDKSSFNMIKKRIELCGPITVSDYMQEVFMNPSSGYYMTKDVFGPSGDFITSPEISQIFGEMLAVWCISEWRKVGSPNPNFLIELGPGRGTMMQDMLRVYNKVGTNTGLSVHLVEMSRELSKIQARKLCTNSKETKDTPHYIEGTTECGVQVYWYHNLESIPQNYSSFVAHEFFDALPIHKFQKTKEGWREVLIDLDDNCNGLRYVLANAPTPASLFLTDDHKKRNHVEISPKSGVIMEKIAQRLESNGGFLLMADYGHNGDKEDTFRAFKNHKQHHPLQNPGMADLTADVDFSYLKKIVENKLVSYGPTIQHDFLKALQIDIRLEVLLRKSKTKEDRERLLSGYTMIMDKDKMGECFKFVSFFPSVLKEFISCYPVIGFENH